MTNKEKDVLESLVIELKKENQEIKQTKSEKDGKYYTNVIIFGICLSDDAKTDAPKKSNKVKMADVNANLPVKEEEPNFDDENDDEEFERIFGSK